MEGRDWLAGRTLEEMELLDEGITLLGIERPDGTYLGSPHGGTRLQASDSLLVYGRTSPFESIDSRRDHRAARLEHERAVRDQDAAVEEEERIDRAKKGGWRAS